MSQRESWHRPHLLLDGTSKGRQRLGHGLVGIFEHSLQLTSVCLVLFSEESFGFALATSTAGTTDAVNVVLDGQTAGVQKQSVTGQACH